MRATTSRYKVWIEIQNNKTTSTCSCAVGKGDETEDFMCVHALATLETINKLQQHKYNIL